MGVGEDHPRIRGEQLPRQASCSALTGSPPHTRGAATAKALVILQVGITPAYAGSRPLPAGRAAPQADHPRIRGEQYLLSLLIAIVLGSPPHTRGAG